MLNEKQINLINSKSTIIEQCVNFAYEFLVLPNIEISFEDCPSGRFPLMSNAAEGCIEADGNGHIYINAPWFAERIEEHQDNVEFYIFHELRHIHQQIQIQLLLSDRETREPQNIVLKWKENFEHYVRNEGEDTQLANVSQEVEIDANAYGILLETFYRNGRRPLLSLPSEALDMANERLQRYLDTFPEFDKYMVSHETPIKIKKMQTVVKNKKVGRNDPCPCGSNKKYKYCCGR